MAKKKVTTEDLARMVQGGFEEVDKRFNTLTDDMRSRFHGVKNRLDVIIANLEKRLVAVKKK